MKLVPKYAAKFLPWQWMNYSSKQGSWARLVVCLYYQIYMVKVQWLWPVLPDIGVKCFKTCPNRCHRNFYTKWSFSKWPNKLAMFLGYFFTQICFNELSKIAQSGHTCGSVSRAVASITEVRGSNPVISKILFFTTWIFLKNVEKTKIKKNRLCMVRIIISYRYVYAKLIKVVEDFEYFIIFWTIWLIWTLLWQPPQLIAKL